VDLFHFPNSDIWHSKYGKTVVTLHDLAPLHFPGQFFRNEQERRNYYEGLGAIKKNADIVITDSEYSRQDIIKKLELSPSKVITVFLGVDDHFSPFRLTGDHWDFLKRKYGIESPFILFLGGMDFRKNAGNVIAAFIDSRQSMFAKYKLIVVGDHAVDSEQSLRVRGLLCDKNVEERVVFCGRIDDHELLVLYNAADLFVFPSLFEGFGFPLLEAMACGCPTISSSCASLPELSGDASVVVDPYDVNSIQKGMLRVISSSDLRSELREKGFRQSARFGWDKTAAQTLAVYRQVVGVG
jgi:glycosyltransferase involved in cell wall biosynthesis